MKTIRLAALALFFALMGAAVALACTPAQQATIPAIEREVCVELRALAPNSAALQVVCATADQLAPFVPALLEAQQAAKAAAPPAASTSQPLVAFSMPSPKRPAAKRHCAQWTYVDNPTEAGATDADR